MVRVVIFLIVLIFSVIDSQMLADLEQLPLPNNITVQEGTQITESQIRNIFTLMTNTMEKRSRSSSMLVFGMGMVGWLVSILMSLENRIRLLYVGSAAPLPQFPLQSPLEGDQHAGESSLR